MPVAGVLPNFQETASNALLNSVFSLSADGFAFVSADFSIRFANEIFSDQWSIPLDRIIGRPGAGLIPEWPRQMIHIFEEVRRTGMTVKLTAGSPLFTSLPERVPQNTETMVIPAPAPDGEFWGWTLVCHEVPEHRRAGAGLTIPPGESARESVTILTEKVIHDFNNILAAILCNLQLITLKLKKQEDVSKYLDETMEVTRKGSNLTKQLFLLTKGEPEDR